MQLHVSISGRIDFFTRALDVLFNMNDTAVSGRIEEDFGDAKFIFSFYFNRQNPSVILHVFILVYVLF